MADPSIQSFCCHRNAESSVSVDILSEFNSDSYNSVCLFSSVIGILGAIYQILPRESNTSGHRWFISSTQRGRHIVVCLAVADLFASFGVFVRSVFWINLKNKSLVLDEGIVTILCAVSAAWIQYFYTATWLWTLVYAIDMRLVLKEREGFPLTYHLSVWIIPALLTSVGLTILYAPNADCHDIHTLSAALLRILPNYFATYVPMATVMIVNPILYFSLTNDVELQVARTMSQFTNKERQVVDLIRFKFSLINLAFYVCWLPNLINGVVIWSLWFNLPHKVLIVLWYVMAVMNPLQALFNCMVYRRWSGGGERLYLPCRKAIASITDRANRYSSMSSSKSLRVHPNESTPLVASSINCSSASEDENTFKL